MLFIALLQTLCATSALAQVSVQTPSSPYQCESSILTWTGGQAPYDVYISPISFFDESSFYERLGPIDEMSVPYTVKVPAGERVRIIVRDSTIRNFNESAFTDPIIIDAGSDDSCLAAGPDGIPQIPSDVGTVGGWPTVGTIPGGRVTPIGPTGTVTSVSGGLSSGSTSPTSDTSEGPSASATGPINEDTPNAGYVAPVTSPVHILLVLGGVGVWWRIEL